MVMTMDKGQRTKDKGHRISQSVIRNNIGVTKYVIKILEWNLPCKVGRVVPNDSTIAVFLSRYR